MNKPTANTAWATAETAKKVEPLESQRQSGWLYKDAPSSGVVNNWMNATHQWLKYFELTSDEHGLRTEALEKCFGSLETVLKQQLEELQRIDAWVGRIQAYIESHPTAQSPPERPKPASPSPGMPSYKWGQIERNKGGR